MADTKAHEQSENTRFLIRACFDPDSQVNYEREWNLEIA
jgi:hypothetical protein